jgi:hypothetical protein
MSATEDHGIEIENGAWLPADGHDVCYFPEPDIVAECPIALTLWSGSGIFAPKP